MVSPPAPLLGRAVRSWHASSFLSLRSAGQGAPCGQRLLLMLEGLASMLTGALAHRFITFSNK